MTEELYSLKTSVFDQKADFSYHSAAKTAQKQHNQKKSKRYVTYRWCSRLAASKLPGAELAVEYLYGKYIRNLSVSTIQQSGRIVLYFLHFLTRDGTTIFTLTRQNISAYVEYEQDRGLKCNQRRKIQPKPPDKNRPQVQQDATLRLGVLTANISTVA